MKCPIRMDALIIQPQDFKEHFMKNLPLKMDGFTIHPVDLYTLIQLGSLLNALIRMVPG